MDDKVTIAIASYNNALYIERCVNSVMNQTYSNLEIIIVDDGSKDDTLHRVEKYKSDERVRVFTQENSGLSSVRQCGLDYSKGVFICFIDADDYLLPNYVMQMVIKLQNDNSDVCVCSTRFENEKGYELPVESGKYKCLTSEVPLITTPKELNEPEQYGVNRLYLSDSWNKMYRVSSIRKTGVTFHMPKGLNGSDSLFNMLLSLHALRYSTVEEVGYAHVIYKKSAAHRKNKNLNATFKNIISDMINESKKLNIWEEMMMRISTIWYMSQVAIFYDEEVNLNQLLKSQKKYAKENGLLPCCVKMAASKGQYIYFCLLKYFPFLVPYYFRIRKIMDR